MNSDAENIRSLKKKGFTLLRQRRLMEAKAIFIQVCETNASDAEAGQSLSGINECLGISIGRRLLHSRDSFATRA